MTLLQKTAIASVSLPVGASLLPQMALLLFRPANNENLFNILWMLVFGFATLNILGMAARQYDPNRRGLNFGEIIAVVIVALAVVLLGWEMLNFLHIFPIKLQLQDR